jgi:hypothetical protein
MDRECAAGPHARSRPTPLRNACDQYQRPRPCQATPVTITVVTSIIVTVVVMTPRYATRHTFGIQRCKARTIRRSAAFAGQPSWAEHSLGNAAAWARIYWRIHRSLSETRFLNRRPNVTGFQNRYGARWRRLPYREVAEGLMFGKGLTATSHVGFFMFNHRGWQILAAAECPSISARHRREPFCAVTHRTAFAA